MRTKRIAIILVLVYMFVGCSFVTITIATGDGRVDKTCHKELRIEDGESE